MTRKEFERKKRRLKAKILRISVISALVISLILMFCGCLYIREHLFQKNKKTNVEQDVTPQTDSTDSTNLPEEPQETEPSIDEQILETYNYQYEIPNAVGLHLVLDAGHGGIDPGTEAAHISEKDINLAITKRMAELMQEAGATITMIRETDEYVDLADRSYKGNQTSADLFLSLHCNYFEGDSTIDGLEVYYHRNSDISRQYAENLTQVLKDANVISMRSASKQNMQVLRNSSLPAIMVEMGFLSNPEECAKLEDPLYQEFLARLLTEKVISVLKS